MPGDQQMKGTEMFRIPKRRRDRVIANLLNTFCSWEGVGSRYVGQFQRNLESLTAELSSQTGLWLKVRFNNLRGCAEIFSPCDRTIAWVNVDGEVCLPCTAHVQVPLLPSPDIQDLFRKHLRTPQWGKGPHSGVKVQFRTLL